MIARYVGLVLALLATAAEARETLSGPAVVVDGDTVRVGDTTVRLKGVDAAERGTARGENARRAMIDIVGVGGLTCSLTGERTWNRQVGFCTTATGVDINREIVLRGFALACPRYSVRYVAAEQPAALAAQRRASYCTRR